VESVPPYIWRRRMNRATELLMASIWQNRQPTGDVWTDRTTGVTRLGFLTPTPYLWLVDGRMANAYLLVISERESEPAAAHVAPVVCQQTARRITWLAPDDWFMTGVWQPRRSATGGVVVDRRGWLPGATAHGVEWQAELTSPVAWRRCPATDCDVPTGGAWTCARHSDA
jgi:hypothetical protein